MTALAKKRGTPHRTRTQAKLPVKANAVIYGGAVVALDATGYAVPASDDPDQIIIGKNLGETLRGGDADNTDGGNGDLSVYVELPYERTEFFYLNDAGTAVTQADVFRRCWALDDQTVTGSWAAGTLPISGRVGEVTAAGVWVEHTADTDVGDLATLDERITAVEEDVAAIQASAPGMQAANATLASGTVTINTGITVAANSEVVPVLIGAITGSTNFGSVGELKSSRVNGAPGVGTVVIQAYGANGALDADAAGAIRVLIFTPLS